MAARKRNPKAGHDEARRLSKAAKKVRNCLKIVRDKSQGGGDKETAERANRLIAYTDDARKVFYRERRKTRGKTGE